MCSLDSYSVILPSVHDFIDIWKDVLGEQLGQVIFEHGCR
jgi:hypothetical protein